MSQENQRYYIFISWKNGHDATKIHEELVNAEGEHALSLSTVRRWVAKFKDRETQVDDWMSSQGNDTRKNCKGPRTYN